MFQYRTPTAFAGVRLMSNLLDTMLAQCGLDVEMLDLLDGSLPAIQLMMRVSPLDVRLFHVTMARVRRMLTSRIARYTDWTTARSSQEAKMIGRVEETIRVAKEAIRDCKITGTN